MMTAEEWQELDPQSRAQLVAVITYRDEPRLARGSGEFAVVDEEPSADTLLALAACKAT
jgi:hypothetical protein